MIAHIPARVEAEKITAQGRMAAIHGHALTSNPYKNKLSPEHLLWKEGFLEEEEEDTGWVPDEFDIEGVDDL